MTLADLLAARADAMVQGRRNDTTLAVLVLVFPNARRLMLLERTYREGLTAIMDPTEAEMAIARGGDLWQLWNSDRRLPLEGIA